MNPNDPRFSWWAQSLTRDDGRRFITLWRTRVPQRVKAKASRLCRGPGCKVVSKLRIRFADDERPRVVNLVARRVRVEGLSQRSASRAAQPGPVTTGIRSSVLLHR